MKARIFIARGGNRCITPMYAGRDEASASINHGTPAGMFAIMAGLEDTREYADVEDGQELRNVPVRLCSPGFEHGAIDLICIGGPMLDGLPQPAASLISSISDEFHDPEPEL